MQHEVTTEIPLLDAAGNLMQPGYAKRMLFRYRRGDIRASAFRIKEWDYYCIGNDRFALALTVDDNGYMGLDSVSFLNFDEKWEITKSPMRLFPMGKTGLPETSERGDTAIRGKDYAIAFHRLPDRRRLVFHMDRFRGGETIRGELLLTATEKLKGMIK